MALIAQAIRQHLISQTALTDLVGARIMPAPLEKSDPLPAITWQVVSGETFHDLSGAAGKGSTTFLFLSVDETDQAATTLGELLGGALDQYRGTVGGESIRLVAAGDHSTNYDPPTGGRDGGRYTHRRFFTAYHSQ